MNSSSEKIIIATIYLLASMYALLTGILTLAKKDIKFPGFYRLGVFITKTIHEEDRVTSFENDVKDRKKAIRYGIFWIFIGLVALAGGIFVLFAA